MNILAVGDIFIPPEAIADACDALREFEPSVEQLFWGPEDEIEQQKNNLLVELNGPVALPVPEEVAARLAEVDALLVHRCPISEDLLNSGPKLKIVGVCRGGHENIDVEAATRLGIRAFHILGRNAEAVSDFTVGLILCESRNIARSHHDILQNKWEKVYSNSAHIPEMKGSTVGLVGLGEVGRRVARKLNGFQARIIVYDPFVAVEAIRDAGAEPAELDELFRNSDFISVHARLQEGTEKLIGKDQISLMKPTAYFINTARAGLVEEQALLDALETKSIAGAALDVFWEEPLSPDSPWLKLGNVTLAAHLAGATYDALASSPHLLVDQVAQYLKTGQAPGLLNPTES